MPIRVKNLIIISFFVSQFVFAQFDDKTKTAQNIVIGEIKVLKGEAWLQQKGLPNTKRKALKSMKVHNQTVITTKKRSFVKIKMIDETTIDLGSSSSMSFDKFIFKNKKDRKSIYNFVVGKMRANFPNKAKAGDLKVKARSVSMAIRGTEFITSIEDNGIDDPITQIALLEGKIDVDIAKHKVKGAKKLKMKEGTIFKSNQLEAGKPLPKNIVKRLDDSDKKSLNFNNLDSEKDIKMFLQENLENYPKRLNTKNNANSAQDSSSNVKAMPSKVKASEDRMKSNDKNWREHLKELQKKRKKNSSYQRFDDENTISRYPAAVRETFKPVCKYKSVCLKKATYKKQDGSYFSMCIDSELRKYPDHCRKI